MSPDFGEELLSRVYLILIKTRRTLYTVKEEAYIRSSFTKHAEVQHSLSSP